jgi:hypothetical protein
VVVVPDLLELEELDDDEELADAVAGVFVESDLDDSDLGPDFTPDSAFEASSLAWCLVACLLSEERESVR